MTKTPSSSSPRKSSTPPRRSSRFSKPSAARSPPQTPSPPPPYQLFDPDQELVRDRSNDTGSSPAQNGSDEPNEAPREEEPDEMIPELPLDLRPIRPLRRGRTTRRRPSSGSTKPSTAIGETDAPVDSKTSKGKRKQPSDDDEGAKGHVSASRKRARRIEPDVPSDSTSSCQTSSPQVPTRQPTPAVDSLLTPLHRSALHPVSSLKRTREDDPVPSNSSKRMRLSLPTEHTDDHSSWWYNESVASRKLAAKENPKPKIRISPEVRAIIENGWSKTYERDFLLQDNLEAYEREVFETFGLDLALVRQAYITPDNDVKYQWTCQDFLQAYPTLDHPAWSAVSADLMVAWIESPLAERRREHIESLDGESVANWPDEPLVEFDPSQSTEEEAASVAKASGTTTGTIASPSLTAVVPTNDFESVPNLNALPPPPPGYAASTLRRTSSFYGEEMFRTQSEYLF